MNKMKKTWMRKVTKKVIKIFINKKNKMKKMENDQMNEVTSKKRLSK